GGYGVEAITIPEAYIDNYYGNIVGVYINLGDSYSPTIIHNSETGEFILSSFGDFMEIYEYGQEDNDFFPESRKKKKKKSPMMENLLAARKGWI
ncbi:hypothetical protein LCGC14_2335180, partial [marine sediment metagenome]